MDSPVQNLLKDLKKRIPKKISLLENSLFELRAWMGADKAKRPKGYLNRKSSFEAYLQYYLPLHLPELFWILDHNRKKANYPTFKNVLDIGAGPGTLSLSLAEWLHQQKNTSKVQLDIVDQSQNALKFAKESLIKSKQFENIQYHCTILPRLPREIHQKKYQLILVGHFLNEWGNGPKHRSKKLDFLKSIIAKNLSDDGVLVIIEPPLREPTHDLMWLRDQLAQEKLNIFGPCPNSHSLCPMLKQRLGWCYAQVPNLNLNKNFLTHDSKIEKWLDIKMTQRSFSYLALQKNEEKVLFQHLTSLTDKNAPRPTYCDGSKTLRKNKKNFRGSYLSLEE